MAEVEKPRVVGFNHIALEVGDIDEDSALFDFLATHFFLEWIEELMHLNRKGASLGLALAFAGGLYFQL